jgi:hypothetical protein
MEQQPNEDDQFDLMQRAVDDIFLETKSSYLDSLDHDESVVEGLYLDAQKVEIDAADVNRVALSVFGGYYPKEVGEVELNKDRDTIILRPVGHTELGVLCALDGVLNAHDEQEYLMIEGSVVVAKHDELFKDGSTAFLLDQWPEAGSSTYFKASLSDCASILTRKILTSAHLSFRPIYTLKEFKELAKIEESPVDDDDFLQVSGTIKGEKIQLFATNYSLLTP